MRQWISRTVIAAAVVLAGVASAQATPLGGGISISGSFVPVIGTSGAVTTIDLATGLDFVAANCVAPCSPTPGVAGTFTVNNGTGQFTTATGGTIKDFSFAGAGSANYPVTPLTSFEAFSNGITFDLTSIATQFQTASVLVLSGTGLFHLTGFDNTPGTFTFTGNGAGGTFSFSASNAAVPEPASMMLFGTGLAGIATRQWRKRRQ